LNRRAACRWRKNTGRVSWLIPNTRSFTSSRAACGTLLLGASGLPIKKLEDTLNEEAADGWQVVFMVIEQKRFMLFWAREAVLVTLGKE
jgi:hypothetical protein